MAVQQDIVIISGLPRSGTSMMMQMLEAGGIPAMTDRIRKADADNPKGYYEFEKVKKVKQDASWMDECKGKAVKMVSALLYDLPSGNRYKVIFMKRQMGEVIASQNAMLLRLGREKAVFSDEEMGARFERHLRHLKGWLGEQAHIEVLEVNHKDVILNPLASAKTVCLFLGNSLNVERMAGVVESALYRQRGRR